MSDLAPDSDSIEADLRAAFTDDTPTPQTEETPSTEAGPARDEHGRFAPKSETVDKPDDTPQIAAAETPAADPEGTTRAPHSLSAAVKAEWASLPKHVQEDLIKLEQSVQTVKTEWAPKGEVFNKFEQLMQPHRDRLTLNGLDPFQYLQALVHADEMLRTNPAAAFPQIASMYGYQLPGAPAADFQAQPQMDPVVAQLQERLDQVTQMLQGQQSAQEQAQTQAAVSEIEAFRNDPAHIYFDNVKARMSTLIKDGHAADLEDAYDQACHADKTIRGLLSGINKPAPGKPNGASVNGSPGRSSDSPTVNMQSSIEDDIRAAMAGGRV